MLVVVYGGLLFALILRLVRWVFVWIWLFRGFACVDLVVVLDFGGDSVVGCGYRLDLLFVAC